MRNVWYGFAAGCEALAMPRRQKPDSCPGYAPGLGFAHEFRAKGRTRGRAKIDKSLATAGRSHRLTSGGGAVLGSRLLLRPPLSKLNSQRLAHGAPNNF